MRLPARAEALPGHYPSRSFWYPVLRQY